MSIDIKLEQEKAKKHIAEQGLRVLVCAGTGCVANGALDIIKKFEELGAKVSTLTAQDKMTIIPTGCQGFCEQGVMIHLADKNVTYVQVKEEDVEEIYESHIKNNTIIERLLYIEPKTNERKQKTEDINFYAKQTRNVLSNCGHISAESLEEAVSVRGYEALAKVLQENNPDAVVKEVED